jgi:hypothetical protein
MDKSSLFSSYNVTKDLRTITLPDGNTVRVRPLSNRGADAFDCACVKTPTLARATLLRWTLCDDDGALLCTDQDIPALADLPRAISTPMIDAATEMNRLTATSSTEAMGE